VINGGRNFSLVVHLNQITYYLSIKVNGKPIFCFTQATKLNTERVKKEFTSYNNINVLSEYAILLFNSGGPYDFPFIKVKEHR
jgi:hypothetical protein